MNTAPGITERRLGRDSGRLILESGAENREVCAHMAGQAARQLRVFSRDLDKPIYDTEPFIQSVRQLVLGNRQAQVKILLQDNDRAVKQGHRLIELARRLSSSIEIRTPAHDWLEHRENFLLADRYGYVHRESPDRYDATADYHAPLRVRELSELFDDIWQVSQVDSELRRLYI